MDGPPEGHLVAMKGRKNFQQKATTYVCFEDEKFGQDTLEIYEWVVIVR